MRRKSLRTLPVVLLAAALAATLLIVLVLRAKSPPEAARLLPESDAIVYLHLKTLRAVSHFDASPVKRSADFQHFIDATGIVPERDLDAVAFALHRMPDPKGPNGPVAYSEVFVGRFDGERLGNYLASIATAREAYAGHTIYSIPVEGRTLRVSQLEYDTVVASNMPTTEQIHSMLDRSRVSALNTTGSSLLGARYHQVPLLSLAWGIGHIGLPFSENGHITVMGLELPLHEDTEMIASLRYAGSVRLRVEEVTPDAETAERTTKTMNDLLTMVRVLGGVQASSTPAGNAMRKVLDSAKIEQRKNHVVLDASASLDQVKALASQTEAGASPAQ